MNTSYWKFQKKCICIFHKQLFYKIPTGSTTASILGMNDELPVHVGHYLQDLGPEGGQGVMRLFINLSLKFAPHRRIERITVWWAGRPDFLRPVIFYRLAFSQAGWFLARTLYIFLLLFNHYWHCMFCKRKGLTVPTDTGTKNTLNSLYRFFIPYEYMGVKNNFGHISEYIAW